jgi:DNA-binding PadR family transcriptional regulator
MTNPFTPAPGGFGFGPADRRALHQQRRQARREFREHLRDHLHEHLQEHDAGPGLPGDFGFGPGGRGFGPGGRGFGPGGRGFEFGFDPRGGFGGFGPGGFGPGGRGRGRGGRGRGKRGDVRAAILKLLAERPMHGYEMIQEIGERSQNLWRPSPGSVYPTLQLLVDEGLIAATESDGSKKLFELTDDGKTAAEKVETAPWDEIAEGWKNEEPGYVNLRSAVAQLMGAVKQAAFATNAEQQDRIVDIVNNARREIYGILGESE